MSLFTNVVKENPVAINAENANFFALLNFLTEDLVERDFFAFMDDDKIESLAKLVLQEVDANFFEQDFCTDTGASITYANEAEAIEFIISLSFKLA